jgi:ribosomal protein L20
MAEFEFDRSELKVPVLRLLAVLAVAAALVWLSDSFKTSRQMELERARGELSQVRSEYRLALEAGDIIKSSQQRYRDLQLRNFIGDEPRLLWIESLRNSGAERKLYNVQYSLRRQQPLMLEGFDSTEHYQVYASPMRLHLELAHEADLVRFFASLNKEQPAVYQVRGCNLAPMFDAKGVAMDRANVSVDCELLWFTVNPLSDASLEEQEESW